MATVKYKMIRKGWNRIWQKLLWELIMETEI